jgi:hypothetical protein
MTKTIRSSMVWGALLVGLGAAAACDSTALVGAQTGAAGTGSLTGGAGTGDPTGGAGTGEPTGAAGTPDLTGAAGTPDLTGAAGTPDLTGAAGTPDLTGAAGAPTGSGGTGAPGPWLLFDSLRSGNRDIYAVQPDGSALKRLTTSTANERQPAVSPDGKTLAFASDATGTFQVYLMALPGGAPRQLTHSAAGADQPAWSPNGKLIAFHSKPAVYTIGVDGKSERLVADQPYEVVEAEHPAFIDDDFLLYDTYHRLYRLKLGAVGSTLLAGTTAPVQHPSLTPSRNMVAISIMCEPLTNGVWLVPLGAFDPCRAGTRVPTGAGYAKFPAVSSTGLIAFERGSLVGETNPSESAAHLGLADLDMVVSDVTHGEGDDRNPSWSPAGVVLP